MSEPATPAVSPRAGPGAASPTYYDRPVLKEPVWIWSVPAYFFAGGTAGAAATLGAVVRAVAGDVPLVRRARLVAAGGHLVGVALLVIDLGRPERFLNMLRVFRPTSPLSVGSWVLAASAPAAAGSAVLAGRASDVAGGVAGLTGLPMATYTGVLLAGTAVPAWQEAGRSLPLAFAGSSMSSAAAFLGFGAARAQAATLHMFGLAGKAMALAGTAGIVVESHRAGPRASAPYRGGASGAMIGASALLTAASAVLSGRRSPGLRAAGAVAAVAGSLFLRFGVVRAGIRSTRDPRATFETQRSALH